MQYFIQCLQEPHEVSLVIIPILKVMEGGRGRVNNCSKIVQLISDGVRLEREAAYLVLDCSVTEHFANA